MGNRFSARVIADRIDRLTSAIGKSAAWLSLGIVIVQFAVVIMRYGFGLGSIWLRETILYAGAAGDHDAAYLCWHYPLRPGATRLSGAVMVHAGACAALPRALYGG